MRTALILLLALLAFNARAELPVAPLNGIGLSFFSLVKSDIESCYRWVSDYEMNQWKKNKPYFVSISPRDPLLRVGKNNKASFCWSNPIGAMQGGKNEEYGPYLLRIDLFKNRVLWDRNGNEYFRIDNLPVLADQKKGVDSDIFYASYLFDGGTWFHEYTIKNAVVIKGFTFGDQDLRNTFLKYYLANKEKNLSAEEYHFFIHHCPFHTTAEDSTLEGFHKNPHRYYCQKYQELIEERKSSLEAFWQTPESRKYYKMGRRHSGH